jgi:hypothetical protein
MYGKNHRRILPTLILRQLTFDSGPRDLQNGPRGERTSIGGSAAPETPSVTQRDASDDCFRDLNQPQEAVLFPYILKSSDIKHDSHDMTQWMICACLTTP